MLENFKEALDKGECVSQCYLHGPTQSVKSVQIRSFFWSVFFRIPTEYGEILRISPHSFQMRENTDQKKLRIWTRSVSC